MKVIHLFVVYLLFHTDIGKNIIEADLWTFFKIEFILFAFNTVSTFLIFKSNELNDGLQKCCRHEVDRQTVARYMNRLTELLCDLEFTTAILFIIFLLKPFINMLINSYVINYAFDLFNSIKYDPLSEIFNSQKQNPYIFEPLA
jgi:hypothetical protein